MRRWPLLLVLVACGDAVVETGREVSDTVGPSLAQTPSLTVNEPCATASPGAPCTNPSDACELGESAALGCNARLTCNGFRWVRASAAAASAPASASASACGACPDSSEPDDAAAAAAAAGLCEYPAERRTCALAPLENDAGASTGSDAEANANADADARTDADARPDADPADAAPADANAADANAADANAADANAADADAADADASQPDAVEPRAWTCVESPEGCPRVRPHEGLRCVVPMTCDYGACVLPGGHAMQCVGEVWHVAEVRCPALPPTTPRAP